MTSREGAEKILLKDFPPRLFSAAQRLRARIVFTKCKAIRATIRILPAP